MSTFGEQVVVQEVPNEQVVIQETGPQGLPGTIVAVGPTAPSNPQVNQLWVDTT